MQLAFAAALERLGPFGPAPRLAVAVSGGADSTALALLARDWALRNKASLTAIIVDHGLRAGSAAEAALTQSRLAGRGIESEVVTLSGLAGPGLQARGRAARYEVLGRVARARGCLHLLLGHHARDQAETVAMRQQRGGRGLAGMPAWSGRHDVLLLRPLLAFPPEQLRAFLNAAAMPWIEDSSNADPRFERVRVRRNGALALPAGAAQRQEEEWQAGAFLAAHVTLRPEGFAVIDGDTAPPAALAALLRMLGGRDYPPPRDAVAALAAGLRPATLGGVRMMPAGRLGAGWLLAREPAACAAPVPATRGANWDRRFQLVEAPDQPAAFGALGKQAADHRATLSLPALVLRTMPCLRRPDGEVVFPVAAQFTPPAPATSHPFSA